MNIFSLISKVNILEGDWSKTESYNSNLYPSILKNQIPVLRSVVFPVGSLQNGTLDDLVEIDVLFLDNKHWHFDDLYFKEYVNKICKLNCKAVCFSEFPFSYDMPHIDIDVYEKKLYERLRIFRDKIKSKNPDTFFIAPPVSIISDIFYNRFIDFCLHNRSMFDVWSLYCCYDLNEQKISFLSGLISKILKILHKPVWVLKWAVPSFEEKIESRTNILSSEWIPNTEIQASIKMRSFFNIIENITQKKSNWFYSAGIDDYHPDKFVPHYIYNPSKLINIPTKSWNENHFLGLIDYKNRIKNIVFEQLIRLAHEYN